MSIIHKSPLATRQGVSEVQELRTRGEGWRGRAGEETGAQATCKYCPIDCVIVTDRRRQPVLQLTQPGQFGKDSAAFTSRLRFESKF